MFDLLGTASLGEENNLPKDEVCQHVHDIDDHHLGCS
jgi:hypothetical protein